MKDLFKDSINDLNELDPKVKEKAIEIAITLIKSKGIEKEEALKQGIKQANEWFIDLEG